MHGKSIIVLSEKMSLKRCDNQRQHFSEQRRAGIAGGKPYRMQIPFDVSGPLSGVKNKAHNILYTFIGPFP